MDVKALVTSEHGPYAGSLGQDIVDYFSQGPEDGLRDTHNSVLTDMPPDLRGEMQPHLPDFRPFGAHTPKRGTELYRATFGAWGIYVHDIMHDGATGPIDQRRRIAVASTLTMSFLNLTEGTVAAGQWREPEAVGEFHDGFRAVLLDGQAPQDIPPVFGVPEEKTTLALAHHMHHHLNLAAEPRNADWSASLVLLKEAALRRFAEEARAHKNSLLEVAHKIGGVTASLGIAHSANPYVGEPASRAKPELAVAPLFLGRAGGVLNHGTRVGSALANRTPTFATAILFEHGGPTKAAFKEIRQTRDDEVAEALAAGREFMGDASRRARGRYSMATLLLKAYNVATARRDAKKDDPRELELLMQDPYWAPRTGRSK